MKPFAIGLDRGTTTIKGVLVAPSGRILASASRPSPLRETPETGQSEIPLGPLRGAAESVLTEILRSAPGGPLRLGIASQRSSFVLWDARTGKPLAPGISWRDRRAIQPWPVGENDVIRRTGLRLSPHYSAGKIARLLPDRPFRVAPLPAWLAFEWSGRKSLSCDPTLAARMLLWNLSTGNWDPGLLRAFGVPRMALPTLRPSRARYGRLGKRLELRAMIGDQQAAAVALGVSEGSGLVNLGTGAFLLVPTGRRIRRAKGLLSTVLWSDRSGARYALEGTVNSAGALFDWMRRHGMGDPGRIPLPSPTVALKLPACLPALAGTGAPRWDPGDRLRFAPDRPSAASALLGVAYRLREIWDALPRDLKPRRLIASGGLSQSGPLLQALADLTRVPVLRSEVREATALGAALLALGRPGNPPEGKRFRPGPSREEGYRRWRRLLR